MELWNDIKPLTMMTMGWCMGLDQCVYPLMCHRRFMADVLRRYLKFHRQGLPMLALRYEKLLESREQVVCKTCTLPRKPAHRRADADDAAILVLRFR